MKTSVLLVEDCDELREAIVFALIGQFPDLDIDEVSTFSEAVECLESSKKYLLVFSNYSLPDSTGGDLFLWLEQKQMDDRFVLVSKTSPDEVNELADKNVKYISKPNIFKPMIDAIDEAIQKAAANESSDSIESQQQSSSAVDGASETHFGIALDMVEKYQVHQHDLFLRISATKFIKILKAGTPQIADEIEKLKKKSISTVYIEKANAEQLVDQKVLEISLNIETDSEIKANQLKINQAILKTIRSMGVTPQIKQLVETTVDAAQERVESVSELSELLKGFDSEDYITSHSTVLAHVGGFLLAKLSWAKEVDYENIALAALLHDIAAADDQIAQAQTNEDLEALTGSYASDSIEEYKTHPLMAADVTKFFTGADFPSEVETMIYQHHERPDGSGFPNGVSHNSITRESAAFILAHEMVNLLSKKWVNLAFPFIVKYLGKHFQGGHFDDILEELAQEKASES